MHHHLVDPWAPRVPLPAAPEGGSPGWLEWWNLDSTRPPGAGDPWGSLGRIHFPVRPEATSSLIAAAHGRSAANNGLGEPSRCGQRCWAQP
ncbi:hypothetical protein E2C01_088905 [Portunus trituberculatus]|uniref:Uncharacterized protein n=1 Tax=Portunus trituberculatus TaxID=210409 RepID=A0A5B7JGQ7_PORTR|nr:hypothetical protein [Portunus trituberculatus]